MKLTKYEKIFLSYYMDNYSAKWMRVYNNKHPLIDTRIDLFTIYKRKLKNQAVTGSETYANMFHQLREGKLYFIPDLLNQSKEEN